jgi:acetylornithine deacetylase
MPSFSPPDSVEALLAAMVAIDTVNPAFGGPPDGQARLGSHLEEIARSFGLHTRREAVANGLFNLIVTAPPLARDDWILFESHLDTVSVEGMTVPPFALTDRDGRLHGRGACDTKGSGAAMLWALREYARTSNRRRNAGLVFVVDEEAGMTGAQAFARGALRTFDRVRGVIVGEPTGLRPVVAHNGALRWRTITRGVAAHSSDPSKGRSAISAMVHVVATLEQHFVPLATATHPLTGRAAASINVIRGGQAGNIIPDYCEIHCDRRLVPGESAETVLAERDRVLAGLEVEHDDVYLAPTLPPETSADFHAWLQPAFAAAGLDGTGLGAPYATDASHYAAAGAPVVVLGPGDIAQAHTRDEWLARSALEQAVAFYGSLLRLPD